MTQLGGSSYIGPSPPVLPDTSRETADRDREPRNKTSAPPCKSCPRCGWLLILDYVTSTGRDITGRPAMARRCVNCGNCMDLDILTNRRKRPEPAPPNTRRARPPTGVPRAGKPQGGGTGKVG